MAPLISAVRIGLDRRAFLEDHQGGTMMAQESRKPAKATSAENHHGTQLGVADLELSLTTLAARDVPATVRSLLRLRMSLWRISGSVAEDIALAAVELASNACAAAPSAEVGFKACFSPATRTVWIGVWDPSPLMPVMKNTELDLDVIDALPADHEFGGWGLSLVRALASECGVNRTPVGKWVYAVFQGKPDRSQRSDQRSNPPEPGTPVPGRF